MTEPRKPDPHAQVRAAAEAKQREFERADAPALDDMAKRAQKLLEDVAIFQATAKSDRGAEVARRVAQPLRGVVNGLKVGAALGDEARS